MNIVFINGKEVDLKSIEFDGIDYKDYPDFCDAYISNAQFKDETDLSIQELEQLQIELGSDFDQIIFNYLF
tara:strand:+ start:30428 stop:30640 length:213 start_codon:yes stop_codon:yes gene_type:complete